jgi:hypothetical protein
MSHIRSKLGIAAAVGALSVFGAMSAASAATGSADLQTESTAGMTICCPWPWHRVSPYFCPGELESESATGMTIYCPMPWHENAKQQSALLYGLFRWLTSDAAHFQPSQPTHLAGWLHWIDLLV